MGEIGVWRATDEEIIAYALTKKATVVTLDADFHTILAVSSASGPSVIRLRLQGLGTTEVVTFIQTVLGRFTADLSRGAAVTVKARKITCHLLPIGRSD